MLRKALVTFTVIAVLGSAAAYALDVDALPNSGSSEGTMITLTKAKLGRTEIVSGVGYTCEEAIQKGEQLCYSLGYNFALFMPAETSGDGCWENAEGMFGADYECINIID